MMNEEGIRRMSLKIVPPDPPENDLLPLTGRRLDSVGGDDGSPVSSSRYSSCGESEFDKYCSANSEMGTPSLCHSVGSTRSFRMGSESGLEHFSLGGEVSQSFGHKVPLSWRSLGECSENNECCDAKDISENSRSGMMGMGNGMNSFGEMGTYLSDLEGSENDEDSVTRCGDCTDSRQIPSPFSGELISEYKNIRHAGENMLITGVSGSGVEEGSKSLMGTEQVDSSGNALHPGLGFAASVSGRYSEEGENSSRFEHSEGEDSMYGYGTNDEKEIGLSTGEYKQNMQEAFGYNENPLLMTSSVAYGIDDWDDFMQEAAEIPQVSLIPEDFQELTGQRSQSENAADIECPSIDVSEQKEEVKEIPVTNEVKIAHNLPVLVKTFSLGPMNLPLFAEERGEVEVVKDLLAAPSQGEGDNLLYVGQNAGTKEASLMDGLDFRDCELDKLHELTSFEEALAADSGHHNLNQLSSASTVAKLSHSMQQSSEFSVRSRQEGASRSYSDNQTSNKMENFELIEFYDEVVHEMEEILLDSGDSPTARLTKINRMHLSQFPPPVRDGGSTASTSSIDDTHQLIQNPPRIDRVEVVGARQKGDVSLGERLVGVTEYTVYRLRVWSGDNIWEVERRYSEFYALYRCLKTSFHNQGWVLPSPWSSVQRESRKFFGNASPNVIADRSILIQDCLQSIVCFSFSSSQPRSLIQFLTPTKYVPSSPAFDMYAPLLPSSSINADIRSVYSLGQSISLIVELHRHKSVQQILEAQHHTCAGCRKHFDDGKTGMWEFVQTLKWGKPRLCEYSGQLFCSSCHTNETAVLPARVLHLWDFTEHPVSQLAKSYLDSIHDQPMLCVSAVNPFLFSRVPPLQHVANIRKRIGVMLPYIRCSFRRSIDKKLGSRRYIIESHDFFALKDLVDLSKGVFAALPVMVETVSKKILEHLTDRCLVCCDAGVPCNARRVCSDPSSLIFPFQIQEGEIEKCRSCGLVFHKRCFKKIRSCPCGARPGAALRQNSSIGNEVHGTLDFFNRDSDSKSPTKLLSGLLSKTSEKLWRPKDSDAIILMGSLPNNTL